MANDIKWEFTHYTKNKKESEKDILKFVIDTSNYTKNSVKDEIIKYKLVK